MEETVLLALGWPIVERIPLGGDLAISPHGITIALGFVVGAWLMIRRARLRGLGHTHVADVNEAVQELLVRLGIGAIIGARLFYVLNNVDIYLGDPLSALAIWEGGLTFLGGVAGAVVAAVPLIRHRGYGILQLADSAAPGLAAGLAIGRIGDLAIGDHLGPAAGDFALGWRCTGNLWDAASNSLVASGLPPQPYPAGSAPVQGCFDVAVHQTALYDLLSAALLFGVLLLLERQPRWDGFFAAVAIYWYGAFRLLDDLLRQDRRWLGLTGSQWAVLTAIVVMTALIARDRPWRRAPWAWAPPDFDLPWRYPATDGDEPGRPESAVRVLPPGPPATTANQDGGVSDRKDLTES
jgi:phosphatidylglycerol:prolipoprotein diacylglycerol transferase